MGKLSSAQRRAFFEAYGEFFYVYTDVEHYLNVIIRRVAFKHTVDEPESKRLIAAVTGGSRMSPAKDTMKRIMRVLKADKGTRVHVDGLFAQLGHIQWLRDRLAHNLTEIEQGPPFFNFDFALIREVDRAEDVAFGIEAIEAAVEDLHFIGGELLSLDEALLPTGKPRPFRPLAWRYKPELLTRNRPKLIDSPE